MNKSRTQCIQEAILLINEDDIPLVQEENNIRVQEKAPLLAQEHIEEWKPADYALQFEGLVEDYRKV